MNIGESKNKGLVFVCQIADSHLKLIKCASGRGGRKTKFISFALEPIPAPGDDKIKEALSAALKSLGYNNAPLVISLPRQSVTLRNIKIPAQSAQEIENIVALQAPRFLPYPAEELVTGYQVISVDKEGYAHVNLVIAHKEIVERYIRIFRELNVRNINVVLSSFGIVNFFNSIQLKAPSPVMFVDLDTSSAEVAVIAEEKLLFSRSFKLALSDSDFSLKLSEEINKSIESYIKDVQGERPGKILICGSAAHAGGSEADLKSQLSLPVEYVSYKGLIVSSGEFVVKISSIDASFVSLMGLGMQGIEESVSLLPRDIKSAIRSALQRKDATRIFILGAAVVLVFMLGFYKNMDNKRKYSERIGSELKKVTGEAVLLEKIDKRSKLMDERSQKRLSSLDVLYGIYKLMPEGVSLVSFTYEEDRDIVLRGQSADLNSILDFVTKLDGDPIFKGLDPKVRYATKKKMQSGEFVDFEVTCSKK